jgi:ribosome-associated protein
MTSQEKLAEIISVVDEMKAENIETVDVRAKTTVTDYHLVCSGNSDRHVQSIADRVEERMRSLKSRMLRGEGDRTGWVLQDYGDVVLHVMLEEQRQFFDIETLWKTAPIDDTAIV